MPLLSARDPLPHLPRRVLVAGTSGSGKTTTAVRLAALLDIRHTEIDALFHGPHWTPRQGFEADVDAFSSAPAWVTEWQYSSVRRLLAARADTLVWLHFPRSTVMRRVIRRTLRRRLRRQRLWNGNVEPPLWTFFTNRDHIVRWAWSTHIRNAHHVLTAIEQHPSLCVVELRDQDEVDHWLSGPLRESSRLRQ